MQRDNAIGRGLGFGVHKIAQEVLEKVHAIEKTETEFRADLAQKAIREEIVAGLLKHVKLWLLVNHVLLDTEEWINGHRLTANVSEAIAGSAPNF